VSVNVVFLMLILGVAVAVATWIANEQRRVARYEVACAAALVVLEKARELHDRQRQGFDVIPEWGRFTEKLEDPKWVIAEAERLVLDHAILLGKTAATEYACTPFTLPDWVVDGSSVYADADREIESHADSRLGREETLIAPFGFFVSFGALVWHRGNQATEHAWRLFVRITESDHWQPRNEMRTQVQVYLTEPSKGW